MINIESLCIFLDINNSSKQVYNIKGFIMSYTDDHFTGNYSGEDYTPAQKYRDERKRFTEFLNQLNEEYRLNIIKNEIQKCLGILEKLDLELFMLFKERTWFKYSNKKSHMHEDEASLLAGYIEFLYILEEQYVEIERLKSGEIKWIGDYNKFIELFEIFYKYNIIQGDLIKFKKFFSLNDNIIFNSKIYDTVIIFHSLVSKNYITQNTVDSLISNGLILSKNGKNKKIVSLSQKQYNDNKSNYVKEKSSADSDDYIISAMERFGIKII